MRKLITGANGLLGSEIVKVDSHAASLPRSIDLRQRSESLLAEIVNSGCECIIHCAARVGGINANMLNQADFFDDNVGMNSNVIRAAWAADVKLVSIMSTCIYPDACYVRYPLTEDQLHIGPPHQSNFGYAYAKRMLDVSARAYRSQFGSRFVTVIPNNLYGPNDNWSYDNSHVIPALVRKFCEAKMNSEKRVTIWGSGAPLREFTFARDAAKIISWVAENYEGDAPLNIGCTDEISIAELAKMIAEIVNFTGDLHFDLSKPEGQMRKPTSNAALRQAGWGDNYTDLKTGLEETIEHFLANYPNLRGIKNS